jgi:hypothetical protein
MPGLSFSSSSRSGSGSGSGAFSSNVYNNPILKRAVWERDNNAFDELDLKDIPDIVAGASQEMSEMSDTSDVQYKYDYAVKYIQLRKSPEEENNIVTKFNILILEILKKYGHLLLTDETLNMNSWGERLKAFGSMINAISDGIYILYHQYQGSGIGYFQDDAKYRRRLDEFLIRCSNYINSITTPEQIKPITSRYENEITKLVSDVIKDVKGGKKKSKNRKRKNKKTKNRKTKNKKTKRN